MSGKRTTTSSQVGLDTALKFPCRRDVMSVEVLASGPQQSRQRRLTRMLLIVSFAWLLLSAPFALHSLAANFISDDHERFADRNLLAKIVCFLLVYINHAINFCHVSDNDHEVFRSGHSIIIGLDVIHVTSLRSVRTSVHQRYLPSAYW